MRLKSALIFIFISISISIFGQNVDSLQQLTKSKEWHTDPSLRWNATAVLNPWFPAASMVFEYPFNKNWGLQIEGGPLLPHVEASYKGEKLKGFRAIVGPKFYLSRKENDVLYAQITFKYDRAETLKFKTLLDPSQSFQQELLVKGKFENIGGILYGGYMSSFWKSRLVVDLSWGLGYTQWEEQITFPNNRSILIRRFNSQS